MNTGASTEGLLLLRCARGDDGADGEIEELIDRKPDWSIFNQLAIRNKVVPLVYNRLATVFSQSMPDGLQELASFREEVLSKNDSNLSSLLDTLALFEDEGIDATPFKGVTFALFVYGNLDLRDCGDIDILVRPDDFLQAKDALVRRGFRHVHFGHAEVSVAQAMLLQPGDNSCVDLHYCLTPLYQHTNMVRAQNGCEMESQNRNRLDTSSTYFFFATDDKTLWDRRDTMSVAGRTVHIFCPEDLLFLSVVHGIKENWRLLRRISDTADLIRKHPDLDWDMVLAQVADLRCKRKFGLGLCLARELCGLHLDDEVSRAINDHRNLKCMAVETEQLICAAAPRSIDTYEFRLIAALFTMDGFVDRVRYFIYIIRRLRFNSYGAKQYFRFFLRLCRQVKRSVAG